MTTAEPLNVSFSGCGFLGIYHVGVASCLREYAPHLVAGKIAGASAGALAASALITGCCLGECTSYTLRVAAKARARALGPLHPSFHLVRILREGLDNFLPDDAHQIASGRLHVSLTRLSDKKNVLVNQFSSRDDLIQCLICSAFVPFYCGVVPPTFRGERYVDGGLSDNVPQLDGNTITVSPFAGESDICPSDRSAHDLHITLANTSIQFTLGNLYRLSRALFPPEPEVLSQMCRQGFEDALVYLRENDLASGCRQLSVHSSFSMSNRVKCQSPEGGPDPEEQKKSDERDECHQSGPSAPHTSYAVYSLPNNVGTLISPSQELPPSIITALQSACDSVNKGLLGPVYNMRAYKVLSLMVAPWILPFDVMMETGQRIYEWAPYLPTDFHWFLNEFLLLVQRFFLSLEKGRRHYSARFTCKIAVTEVDYSPSHKLMSLDSRRSSSASTTDSLTLSRNLNLDFRVNFQSSYESPVEYVNKLKHQLVSDDRDKATAAPVELECDNASYDTFEQCLHMTNDMESVLAFYYTSESDPSTVKVTEIYSLNGGSASNSVSDLTEAEST